MRGAGLAQHEEGLEERQHLQGTACKLNDTIYASCNGWVASQLSFQLIVHPYQHHFLQQH